MPVSTTLLTMPRPPSMRSSEASSADDARPATTPGWSYLGQKNQPSGEGPAYSKGGSGWRVEDVPPTKYTTTNPFDAFVRIFGLRVCSLCTSACVLFVLAPVLYEPLVEKNT